MTRASRLRLAVAPFALAFLAGSLAVGVPRAGATDPFPTGGVATLTGKHFEVHYTRDGAHFPDAYITQERAGDVLGMADRAYDYFRSLGYTAPVPEPTDGDPYVDISIDDFCFPLIIYAGGIDFPDAGLVPPFNIDPAIPKDADDRWCRWNGLINSTPDPTAGGI